MCPELHILIGRFQKSYTVYCLESIFPVGMNYNLRPRNYRSFGAALDFPISVHPNSGRLIRLPLKGGWHRDEFLNLASHFNWWFRRSGSKVQHLYVYHCTVHQNLRYCDEIPKMLVILSYERFLLENYWTRYVQIKNDQSNCALCYVSFTLVFASAKGCPITFWEGEQ